MTRGRRLGGYFHTCIYMSNFASIFANKVYINWNWKFMYPQEIHKKELDSTTRQLEALKQEMGPIQKESEDLKQLYDKQDSLLGM